MHRLDTPENLALAYETADIGSRFVAATIDTLAMVGVVVLALLTLIALSLSPLASLGRWVNESALWRVLALFQLFFFAVFWGYYVFFEMVLNGQSPGKRVLKLRVIRQSGYPIGLANSIIRNLVRLIDFLPALYLIGVATMLLNGRARRLGDLAAGTIVVKERADYRIGALEARLADNADALPLANVERLGPDDYLLLREFFLRRSGLPKAKADELAGHIARGIARKLGGEVGADGAEAYLRQVGAAYERYHERPGVTGE